MIPIKILPKNGNTNNERTKNKKEKKNEFREDKVYGKCARDFEMDCVFVFLFSVFIVLFAAVCCARFSTGNFSLPPPPINGQSSSSSALHIRTPQSRRSAAAICA